MLPTPAGVLGRLLRIVSSRDEANAALGDVLEELAERKAAGRGPRWPALWVNLHALRQIGSTMWAGAPRLIRSMGLILRDATRALRAAPANTLFVILVLAIGVTVGTITFSVVDAVVLRPLPVDQPEQLVTILTRDKAFKQRITPEKYWRLREHLDSVEQLTARSTTTGETLTVGGVIEQQAIFSAGAEIFPMLRWSTALGRLWTTEEEQRGETGVAVLGYRFWRQRLHGDPSVLGETISAGRSTYRIIGVLSESSDRDGLDLTTGAVWV